jgi:hypothetical protein
MSTELWIAIIVPLLGITSTTGTILWRLKTLEKKMNLHNGIVKKVYVSENDIETMKEDIRMMQRQT